MAIIYFLIALLATTVGAGAGIGGGVIIKPALDALGGYNVFVIGVLASATVLAMAIVSIGKNIHQGVKLDSTMVFLAAGAVLGGFLGKEAFSFVYERMEGHLITTVQAAVLIFLLLLVLVRKKLPDWHIKNKAAVLAIGLLLGAVYRIFGNRRRAYKCSGALHVFCDGYKARGDRLDIYNTICTAYKACDHSGHYGLWRIRLYDAVFYDTRRGTGRLFGRMAQTQAQRKPRGDAFFHCGRRRDTA